MDKQIEKAFSFSKNHKELMERDSKVISGWRYEPSVFFERGEGVKLFDVDGNQRIVNVTDINTIGGQFGNMLYGSGIANLFYSIDKDDITCKKLYGSEYLMTASL